MKPRGWSWGRWTLLPSQSIRPWCWRVWPRNCKSRRQPIFWKDQNAYLEAEVKRRGQALAAIQDVTMAMASLAETRDNDTGNHIRRTQHYVRLLAQHLQTHPRFRIS